MLWTSFPPSMPSSIVSRNRGGKSLGVRLKSSWQVFPEAKQEIREGCDKLYIEGFDYDDNYDSSDSIK